MLMAFTPASQIVPKGLDATKWEQLEPLYRELVGRDLHCVKCLERLLMDRSELDAAVSEAGSTLYINMTCATDDKAATDAFTAFVENVEPKLKQAAFELDRKIVAAPMLADLDQARYCVMIRDLKASIRVFREENIPIQTELTMLGQEYAKVCAAMTVQFDGKEQTLSQMGRYNDVTDRSVREGAWRAAMARRMQDAEKLDGILEKMIPLRHQMAVNAGFRNFVDYSFVAKRRFDYSPRTCAEFAKGIEEHVTPLVRKLNAHRAKAMGLSALKPWDAAVDPQGRQPLRPFNGASELVGKTTKVFDKMDAELSKLFRFLSEDSGEVTASSVGAAGGRSLDLESRKGKAPGGYQSSRERMRKPFIFMNAAGVQRDVDTMLHEAGHAFHSLLVRGEPLLHYRAELPMEFAEVASMSMELLSYPYMSEFYGSDDARARRTHLEGVLRALITIAIIDQFQHWMYEHPQHTRAERHEQWVALQKRLGMGFDWSGLEHELRMDWQRILHIYEVPLYYIEYGIAQLGALQVWLNAEKDRAAAIASYKKALGLGASKPLPELFRAAGAEFDFGPATIKRLAARVEQELDATPA